MGVTRGTWLAIAGTAAVFALLNLHAWQPGIGGRTDRKNGERPTGSELELCYGWPACYQAELLRSDDPGMGRRVLEMAPFYLPPYSEGWVSSRTVGAGAIALDVGFALLALVLVAVVFECQRRERWPRSAVFTSVTIVVLLAVGYWSAKRLSVSL